MARGQKGWARNYVGLTAGVQVRYSFLLINGTYYVRFRNRQGKWTKTSTGASKKPDATTEAHRIIRQAYEEAVPSPEKVTWEVAKAKLEESMQAARKRPRTIEGYKETLDKFIALFPQTRGPGDVSENLAGEFNRKYATTRFVRKRKVAEGEGPQATRARRKARTAASAL